MPRQTALGKPPTLRHKLRRLLRSPRLEAALGLVIFLVGLAEIMEETAVAFFPAPDLHHALLMFGAVTGLRGLIDVIEGAGHFIEGEAHANPAHHTSASAEQSDGTGT